MRLLLDTHALVWWITGDISLSAAAKAAIASEGTELFVSPVVPWEIAIKLRTKRWPGAVQALDDIALAVQDGALRPLPITLAHARLAGSLASSHKDPFDRMLAAQGLIEGIPVVTLDPAFRSLECDVLW